MTEINSTWSWLSRVPGDLILPLTDRRVVERGQDGVPEPGHLPRVWAGGELDPGVPGDLDTLPQQGSVPPREGGDERGELQGDGRDP